MTYRWVPAGGPGSTRGHQRAPRLRGVGRSDGTVQLRLRPADVVRKVCNRVVVRRIFFLCRQLKQTIQLTPYFIFIVTISSSSSTAARKMSWKRRWGRWRRWVRFGRCWCTCALESLPSSTATTCTPASGDAKRRAAREYGSLRFASTSTLSNSKWEWNGLVLGEIVYFIEP